MQLLCHDDWALCSPVGSKMSTNTTHQGGLPMSSSSLYGLIAVHVSHTLRQRQLVCHEQRCMLEGCP